MEKFFIAVLFLLMTHLIKSQPVSIDNSIQDDRQGGRGKFQFDFWKATLLI